MIIKNDPRYLNNWLFIDSKLNVREAAKRLLYWLGEAESTGSCERQDIAHDRAKLLARLIMSREHVEVKQ